MIKVFIILITIILSTTINADNKKLPIPRFVSIKSNEVNARSGPTTKSAVEWVFVKKGEPVEITAEYEQWRQVRDIKGEGGWIHSSVLSGKRSVVITSDKEIELTKSAAPKSRVIAKLIPKVRCGLKKCKEQFCQITCKNYTGWISKKVIWGVYDDNDRY
ncbi:MAG: SH3 domain-containing protein [Rickettsia endosymbiont of Ecitomorpha arachnoides]|nr:SH3 domain-containing protein [Rickettsia endosymbiont of Sceptobius lativentris]MCC8462902.1 SH3 domain-containing protein [Rickettsia endosymbiont of Ecitomorpha arachnoides]